MAEKKSEVKDLKKSDLPAAMQNMPAEKGEAFVKEQSLARADIQRQLNELGQKRDQFLQDARRKASVGKQALDQVMQDSIREQAKQKGFKFD